MSTQQNGFAQIVIPAPLKDPLTYAIPPSLLKDLSIGMRVRVPLGRRKVTGVVIDLLSETSLREVKEVLALLDEKPVLDSSLIRLCQWTASYYLCPLGDVLASVLPANLRSESERIVHYLSDAPSASETDKRILDEVRKARRLSVKRLARRFPGAGVYRALNRLALLGAIELGERKASAIHKTERELSHEEGPAPDAVNLTVTPEQDNALGTIKQSLRRGGFEVFLLYGVTGSGKTEVYLRAMEEARSFKKRSLLLVPEIALTPQLLDRLRERFSGRVGVLHSGLTSSERRDQWLRSASGNVDVVIGARSAIFAPLPDLGLIIVDEEHDASYKQEEGVRYQARDLSVVRGRLACCPVLLGSATPSIESFENSRRGRYHLLEMSRRVERKALPRVEMVDLRVARVRDRDKEGDGESHHLFSPELKEALKENYTRGKQSLIFLNRRGFANFLQCRLCGFVCRCPNCSVTMTFHLRQRGVFCHHCGYRRPATDLCAACGNLSLMGIGFGTEQVEQELSKLLPEARIARMDRDSTRKRGSQERIIRRWEKGEIDILVGTQMITKGHNVTGVTLVGVILADLSLNFPDFRATERTFQLLTQVGGRAGRGDEPGRVIIQTYVPEHYALECATTHDYRSFFAAEIEFRRALNYPPFSRLVHLRIESTKAKEAEDKAKLLGEKLRGKLRRDKERDRAIEILGPSPAPLAKLRTRYRWQILLKGEKVAALQELAKEARSRLPRSSAVRLFIDVDPYNML